MFSPSFLTSSIVRPLRFLFKYYAEEDFKWDSDELKSKIEIDSINNFHKKAIQANPRVLISRGGYQADSTGLTDNLAESNGPYKLKGAKDDVKFILIRGMAQILIQSRQEGTCERVCEMVQHFVTWTSPYLCNTQGFKNFAFPLQVSPCTPNKEDTEIFEISIGLPWIKEEKWRITSDALKIKGIMVDLASEELDVIPTATEESYVSGPLISAV